MTCRIGAGPGRVSGSVRALLLALLALSACRIEPEAAPDSAPGTDAMALPETGASEADRPTPTEPLSADAARVPRPPPAASGLTIPVAGVEAGDLVDTFTDARSEGRTHDAIDILAPRGTPVVAAADGEVARLFTSENGGLTVYQIGDAPAADGRHLVYYYAHLDAYAPGLEAGDWLRRGDPVGTVGDSGNAAPGNTHLHFAIWTVPDPADFWDGEPVNPYRLLGGR